MNKHFLTITVAGLSARDWNPNRVHNGAWTHCYWSSLIYVRVHKSEIFSIFSDDHFKKWYSALRAVNTAFDAGNLWMKNIVEVNANPFRCCDVCRDDYEAVPTTAALYYDESVKPSHCWHALNHSKVQKPYKMTSNPTHGVKRKKRRDSVQKKKRKKRRWVRGMDRWGLAACKAREDTHRGARTHDHCRLS